MDRHTLKLELCQMISDGLVDKDMVLLELLGKASDDLVSQMIKVYSNPESGVRHTSALFGEEPTKEEEPAEERKHQKRELPEEKEQEQVEGTDSK